MKTYKVLCIKNVGGFDFKKGKCYDCYETYEDNFGKGSTRYINIKCIGYTYEFLECFKTLSEVRKEKLEKLNYITGI